MQIEFIWDEKKNAVNQRKHDISFEEAMTCFEDEHARVFFDAEHVIHRIISARRATKKEFQYYWNERKGDGL